MFSLRFDSNRNLRKLGQALKSVRRTGSKRRYVPVGLFSRITWSNLITIFGFQLEPKELTFVWLTRFILPCLSSLIVLTWLLHQFIQKVTLNTNGTWLILHSTNNLASCCSNDWWIWHSLQAESCTPTRVWQGVILQHFTYCFACCFKISLGLSVFIVRRKPSKLKLKTWRLKWQTRKRLMCWDSKPR